MSVLYQGFVVFAFQVNKWRHAISCLQLKSLGTAGKPFLKLPISQPLTRRNLLRIAKSLIYYIPSEKKNTQLHRQGISVCLLKTSFVTDCKYSISNTWMSYWQGICFWSGNSILIAACKNVFMYMFNVPMLFGVDQKGFVGCGVDRYHLWEIVDKKCLMRARYTWSFIIAHTLSR